MGQRDVATTGIYRIPVLESIGLSGSNRCAAVVDANQAKWPRRSLGDLRAQRHLATNDPAEGLPEADRPALSASTRRAQALRYGGAP